MLVLPGMMKFATVLLGSASSVSSGSRWFHSGLILILWFLSSYVTTPFPARNCEYSTSLSASIPVCSDSSATLCQASSLRIAKNLSISKFVHKCSVGETPFKADRTSKQYHIALL